MSSQTSSITITERQSTDSLTKVISHSAIVPCRYNDPDVGLPHLVSALHEHVALAAATVVAALELGRIRLRELKFLRNGDLTSTEKDLCGSTRLIVAVIVCLAAAPPMPRLLIAVTTASEPSSD